MSKPNALKSNRDSTAIYFHSDGFDPNNNELNGRRIAGESFLRGYLQHANYDALCAAVDTKLQADAFRDFAKRQDFSGEVKTRLLTNPGLAGDSTCLNMPGPNISEQAWRRRHMGGPAYSICGITHTTATKRVLQGIFDLRVAPVEEWDGIICTSKAVQSSVSYQFDLADDHMRDRFGKVAPRPQTPVIPLGIHTQDFARNEAARKSWRERLNIASDELIVFTMSRLNAFGKFDPLPMFQALEIAANTTKTKIHYLAVGPYSDNVTRRIFENGAAELAPTVRYHHIDGTKEPMAMGLWSAADIFTHPVDNIQETFGLAPVEAMAAGLPVVVSDWDGFKDTITNDVGYRIATYGPKSGQLRAEALRYYLGTDNYAQYMAQASFQTSIDVRQMAQAFSDLFKSPELRAKLGKAGVKRAQSTYDWQAVIPQYEAFWAELSAIRTHKLKASFVYKPATAAVGADPADLFASYPTGAFEFAGRSFQPQTMDDANEIVLKMVKLRELAALKRASARAGDYSKVLELIQTNGRYTYESLQRSLPDMTDKTLERCLSWLLKYDFISMGRD